jgi:HK97 family phage major capsid protein
MSNGEISTREDVAAVVREVLGTELSEVREMFQAKGQEMADNAAALAKANEEAESAREAESAKAVTNRRFTYSSPFEGGPENSKRDQGVAAARYIRLLAAGRNDPERAAKIAESWGDKFMAKALNESVFESGGALVPEDFMAEIIELLRARTVVRAAGAGSVPMPRGQVTIPYQSGASTASYIGELANIPNTEPTWQQMTLTAKKLSALVPISNDLLRDASPSVDALVRNDLVQVMSLREDLAFIRDDGTSNTPKGMRHQAPASNVNAQAGATLANITNDLHDMMLLLENANIPGVRNAWLFAPRTASGIMRIRDTNGNFVFRSEMLTGTLMGHPFFKTTQIPTNLGGGSDSEYYFADFSSLMIGESMGLEISAFEGGAYNDGNNVVSGISTDQTVLRAIARHDFGARQRGSEISILTGVTY